MKITLLVPCYNEELTLDASIQSCLKQTRQFDQIIFIDDSSTDNTSKVLQKYKDKITIKKTPKNTGNKSHAQEYGLQFVKGDIIVTTDADTIIDKNFCKYVEEGFQDPDVVAISGYVVSLPGNWLTLCRAFEYMIGQNIHKLAQSYMNYMFVMPGAASAFRHAAFKEHIDFDHDTITEDLDFTYKLHHKKLKLAYDRRIISYTQDPDNLKSYINQLRRWYGGGWQNLRKHYKVAAEPVRALELSLMYFEGVVFSVLLFLIPVLNPFFGMWLMIGYLLVGFVFSIWAAIKLRRPAVALAPIPYMLLSYINAYIFLEQCVREFVLKRKTLTWFKPERKALKFS